MLSKYRYDGTKKFSIDHASTDETSQCKDKDKALARLEANQIAIDDLQKKLFAEKKEGVIFLFQAMDAAGKDGTITAVMQDLSPHGVYEVPFKVPSQTELAHDFLWRVEAKVPAKGEIAIFNRSHYEDVLIGKVKELYKTQAHADRIDPDHIIDQRYEDIRNWEKYLYHNSVRTVKIFLHVSKDEQARRFLDRIEEPEKNWKFSESDWQERDYWDAYQQAFQDAINATATKEAPWYVIPADHKWYMRYLVSEIIRATLKEMDPHYPQVTEERRQVFADLRSQIAAELGKDDLLKKQDAREDVILARSKGQSARPKKPKKDGKAKKEKKAKPAEKA